MNVDKVYIKRYSLAFKQSVVREYESGASLYALGRRYGIGGAETIRRWVKQYGRAGLRHEVVVMQRAEEQERVKALEARIAELEAAVADLALDKLMLESILEVASQEAGEDLKKKAERTLSRRRGGIRGRK